MAKSELLAKARMEREKADGVKPAASVTVTKDRLEINETIMFGSNNAIIDSSSFALLNLVASTLLDNPLIIMVEIAGHTNGMLRL
jgi:hypothetical protein